MFSLIIGLLSASLLTALRISLFAKRPHRKRAVDAYSLTVDKFHSMYGLDRKANGEKRTASFYVTVAETYGSTSSNTG
jgi:hypothetical protein